MRCPHPVAPPSCTKPCQSISTRSSSGFALILLPWPDSSKAPPTVVQAVFRSPTNGRELLLLMSWIRNWFSSYVMSWESTPIPGPSWLLHTKIGSCSMLVAANLHHAWFGQFRIRMDWDMYSEFKFTETHSGYELTHQTVSRAIFLSLESNAYSSMCWRTTSMFEPMG